ncbi:hypothetical protein A7985_25215 [Pseudoalteromonas luteoviolacea]|uniref:Uncharacterized protein n=1 Tax=Pseudoalteromonas luteoviolacea TaxID=43657 RepID=A0A1C0TII1_9GAMM|nr:hypothetical protein [Pseudoalteromonas luteoviolacea]OCQ17904.1 hypothetical protein A7985_25215 [Pseudoalteromonas luteoviolacea]
MKVSEFSLWAFKLDLELSRQFTLFNRCVCAHFERHLGSVETNGIYRVVIKLSDLDEREGKIEVSNSVLKYYRTFNFSFFQSLDTLKKKELLLTELINSLIQLCDSEGWPKKPFLDAYDSVVKEKFVNIYTIKRKQNRSRTLEARIIADHNETTFDCFLNVNDKDGNLLVNEKLFSEEPDEYIFNSRIGDIKWLDSSTIVYISNAKQELARFSV